MIHSGKPLISQETAFQERGTVSLCGTEAAKELLIFRVKSFITCSLVF